VKGLAACPSPRLPGELGKGLLEKVSPLLQGWSGPCITSVLGHQGLLCYGFAPINYGGGKWEGAVFEMWLCHQLLMLGIMAFITAELQGDVSGACLGAVWWQHKAEVFAQHPSPHRSV